MWGVRSLNGASLRHGSTNASNVRCAVEWTGFRAPPRIASPNTVVLPRVKSRRVRPGTARRRPGWCGGDGPRQNSESSVAGNGGGCVVGDRASQWIRRKTARTHRWPAQVRGEPTVLMRTWRAHRPGANPVDVATGHSATRDRGILASRLRCWRARRASKTADQPCF